jgi:hypothetical protein
MFRFLAKSALATVIWKRYRRPLGSTLALLVSYFFIAMVHSDYVAWATTTAEHEHLWASFVVKWLALIGVTLLYYWFNSRALSRHNAHTETRTERQANTHAKRASAPADSHKPATGPDPFAEIRRKDKLRSRADIAMDATTAKRR